MGTKLSPGETSIDTVRVHRRRDGVSELQWRICLPSGKVERHYTRGTCTHAELRRRARETAADIIATCDGGAWSPKSHMADYVEKSVMPMVEGMDDLRPNTRDAYLRCLRAYADAARGVPVSGATRASELERALVAVARAHGTATARQTTKVVSRYVLSRLVRDGVIDHNPLRDFTPRLPEVVASAKPKGGTALTAAQYARCLTWLLSLDPATEPRRRGRTTPESRQLVIDATLTQAVTGLRIGEVRTLTAGDVTDEGGTLVVTVTPEKSKTHKGRYVPVTDERVADRIRARVGRSDGADGLLFPATGVDGKPKPWDAGNAQKATKRLYAEMAEACGVPVLHSHAWRATLNSIYATRGVPDAVRANLFGHTEEVNAQYYTDLSDVPALVDAVSGVSQEVSHESSN